MPGSAAEQVEEREMETTQVSVPGQEGTECIREGLLVYAHADAKVICGRSVFARCEDNTA
jgi:hypothetical protein